MQKRSVILLSATLPAITKQSLANSFLSGLKMISEYSGEENENVPLIDFDKDNEDINQHAENEENNPAESSKMNLNSDSDSGSDSITQIADPMNIPYPLITRVSKDVTKLFPATVADRNKRDIQLSFFKEEKSVFVYIREQSRLGKCIVWIRNTVKDVQDAYSILANDGETDTDSIRVFHSRFIMADRQIIESEILKDFGKDSGHRERNGKIILATQVVEQSLDIDFDEMITDLCPVDLIIQRSGRLQRHFRNAKGDRDNVEGRGDPVLHIVSPDPDAPEVGEDWYSSFFKSGANVYKDAGILWKTAKVLKTESKIRIPENARLLIESVYGSDLENESDAAKVNNSMKVPEALKKSSVIATSFKNDQMFLAKEKIFKLDKGFIKTDGSYWDDLDSLTRSDEGLPTVHYTLCYSDDGALLKPLSDDPEHPWQMSRVSFRKEEINYDTVDSELLDKIKNTIKSLPNQGRDTILLPMQPVLQFEDGVFLYASMGVVNGKHFCYDRRFGLRMEEG